MEDSQDMPGALVEAYFQHERGTVALLDDLEKLALEGRGEELRERVRAFAEESREVFFAVALALSGSEEFYDDVESQLDGEAVEALEDLAETYGLLAEPFKLVRMEVSNDRQNPVTSIDVTTAYSLDEEVPIIDYTAHSGGLTLYEHRGTPQEVLQSAGYLVQATNDSLEAALDQDRSVNTDELSGLIDSREKLESELSTLRDHIDQLRRHPITDE
jgi:hypothetical protein